MGFFNDLFGGGGTDSQTTITALSEQISNIAMNTVMDCEVSSDQAQSGYVVQSGFNWGNLFKFKQSSEISNTCFQDSNRQTKLQNDIINAISQASSAQGVAVLNAFGKGDSSQANANLTNIIRNSVTMSNIQQQYTDIKQRQNVVFYSSGVSIGTTLDVSQGAQAFAASTLKVLDNAGVFNSIKNSIDQTSSAESKNPLDFLGNLFSGITSMIIIVVLAFLFIILVFVGVLFAVSRGSSNETGESVSS